MNSKLLTALASIACAPLAQAQFPDFGAWTDLTSNGTSVEIYVSAANTAPGGNGSLSNPFKTITQALALAQSTPNAPVTINVMPGTYNSTLGESFPLTMPAFGVSIETYDPQGNGGVHRAVIDGAGSTSLPIAIYVDRAWNGGTPNTSLPGSVIQGLVLTGMSSGIEIVPSLLSPGTTVPYRMEIRDCLFRTAQGIVLPANNDGTHLHVIENNVFGSPDANSTAASYSAGIHELPGQTKNGYFSSLLIRSNTFHACEEGYWLQDSAIGRDPNSVRPRLESNFFQLAQRAMAFEGGAPIIVNNTIAFAAFRAAGVPFAGIDFTTAAVATQSFVHNNLFWNPTYTDSFGNLVTPADTAPAVALTVDNRQTAAGTPRFVSFDALNNSDSHPYNTAALGGATFSAKDLHLARPGGSGMFTGSPAIDAGSNQWIGPAGPNFQFQLNGQTVRFDTACDADLEPRASAWYSTLTVDQGADEVEGVALTLGVAQHIDGLGNAYRKTVGQALQFEIPVQVMTTPNTYFEVALGYGFTNNEEPVPFNAWTPWGNLRVDLSKAVTVATGTTDANGLASATLNLGVFPYSYVEGETYLQAYAYTAPGTSVPLDLSRRIKIEFNDWVTPVQ